MIRSLVRRYLVHCIATASTFFTTAVSAQQSVAEDTRANNVEWSAQTVLSKPVSITLNRASVADALLAIGHSVHVRIQYQNSLLDGIARPVTLHVRQIPLGEVLTQVLDRMPMRAVVLDRDLVSIAPIDELSRLAGGEIVGRVVDSRTKRPLPRTTIAVDGINRAEVTEDGAYRISNVTPGTHTVTAKRMGYTRLAHTVTIPDATTLALDLALEPSTIALDQVVVTGTVIPAELKTIPNAINVITAKQLEERGITKIEQLFRGDIPGLFAQNQGSSGVQPGQVAMASRGSTQFQHPLSQPIKTYVDGVELSDPSYLGLIDPKSIERIEIITGPQASTIYGSNAINGVMQVFTKRGETSQPQLTVRVQSGLIQNNFNSAMTPQHDDALQVAGIDGHFSYNVGGSWTYTGPWTPSVHTATTSGFGGIRLQQGPFNADVSVRRAVGTNWMNGAGGRLLQAITTGDISVAAGANGVAVPKTYATNAQTLSLTIGYSPVQWWSHTVTLGTDATSAENHQTRAAYLGVYDSLLSMSQTNLSRTSWAYTTNVHVPLGSIANAVVTTGVDGWSSASSSLTARTTTLTGTLTNGPSFDAWRQPGHNRGAFLQGQVGTWDALFVTYGLRAEWNPNYGDQVNPNIVPRYGIAYVQQLYTPLGPLTAKVRASYGHATRPPNVDDKATIPFGVSDISYYGNGNYQLANPALLPEQQRGGEGGIELYFGNRGSIVVTRYNQTVDDLIQGVKVDSVDLLPAYQALWGCDPWQCSNLEYENLNVGSIRNQGWEAQGTVNEGPWTVRGTYSFTKSRVLGITPKYQAMLNYIVPGAAFSGVPEHTYAVQLQYARNGTSATLNMHGQGPASLCSITGCFGNSELEMRFADTRLRATNAPFFAYRPGITYFTLGYMTSDLNMSQHLSSHADGLLQIQNLTNRYASDNGFTGTVIGRQSKIGLRIRY